MTALHPPTPNEIAITRVYDAPVSLVWDAWTDPDQVAQWWGPRGFTLTTHSKDLRPGGHWHYTMHGPDGTDYINKTKYFVVEPQRKLVYDHGGNDEQAPLFRVTVVFTDLGGKQTQMEMRMALPTPEAARESKAFIKEVGGNSTWDRLAEYLEKESTEKDIFVINRTFDAPIDTLFDMWTKPEHFSQWLPPTGFTMEFRDVDIRAGGSGTYSMTDGKDVTMYGRIAYQQIDRPNRLVYTQQFLDAKGNISRHPLLPVWPDTMHTTVLFTPETPTSTRVLVRWEPTSSATDAERKVFIEHRASMTVGWTGSFDKLDELIAGAHSHAA